MKQTPGPLAIYADSKLIEQVITNLLSNALNYTPPGGQVWVRTAFQEDKEGQPWVTISIQDTGPGIHPTEQAQLFKRFYRGKAAKDSNVPGTGLGLAICKEIISLHQGHIEVTSGLDSGSTFTLWLSHTLAPPTTSAM